ncbi:MAG: flavodoxin reductase [Crocinitomicaceae bacterium]|nr:flavodoxin reductase [Crocinitomicaceae bacterium]|tara:strand:+ start:11448 stop:12512 length:1065 start_codon:yes stop_codon:yes gene_type:complete
MSQFHKLKVKDIIKETKDTVSVSFDLPSNLFESFKFKAGQYLTLKCTVNGEECRRSYSICSSPINNEPLTVAVKKVINGKVSNYLNNDLSVGDEIEVMEPQGNFVIENQINQENKFVAFAAGSGITPIMSMIKDVSDENSKTKFLLFYGNKTEEDVIFKNQLDNLVSDRIEIHYLYTQQSAISSLLSGRINSSKTTDLMKSKMDWLNADGFYMCGPEQMIMDIKESLQDFGVVEDKINYELFTVPVLMGGENKPVEVEDDFDGDSMVTVICDDEEVEFELSMDGDTILDAAMDEDLDVPFSCKGAVCCTCKAKVVEGKVIMDANYALSEQEVEDGYVLACQAHPASSKVIVDFD